MDRDRRTLRPALIALVLGAWPALGCGADTLEGIEPQLDFDVFVERVQPVLDRGCSNPGTCHGSEQRPLALYSRRANRLVAADVFVDPPLSSDELRANFERSLSFVDVAHPERSELLTKPLAPSAGGMGHRGGTVFVDTTDREYQEVLRWIANTTPQ